MLRWGDVPLTQAQIQEQLTTLYARRAASAGVRNTTFSDQSTTFDNEGLEKIIASLEQQLAAFTRGSSTRYASTSKGC